MKKKLPLIAVEMMTQPNDTTCGPTCLHAVYHYYKDTIPLEQVITEVEYLETGGTLAVLLALHALKRGYKTKIYTYNLKMFDPSWLIAKNINLIEKLEKQLEYKLKPKFQRAGKAYIEYLKQGGQILFEDLSMSVLNRYFSKNIPIIAGLSATYLYQSKRELSLPNHIEVQDDIQGTPQGHFVVLCGQYEKKKQIVVADPYVENPISKNNYYLVDRNRLINSMMLGILTYDANFLVIEK